MILNDDKSFQKNRLIMEFGIFIQPFKKLVNSQSIPSISDYRVAAGKVRGSYSQFENRVHEFVIFSDVIFAREAAEILVALNDSLTKFEDLIFNYSTTHINLDELQNKFKGELENVISKFIELINDIPIDWQPKIFQANTQFTTYLCMLDCTANARQHLHYFDRYLNLDFFSLYLRNLDRSTSIRLVTTKGNNGKNGFGVDRINRVSDLCRQEFNDYKLIQLEQTDFHDRNLRIDEQIFTLGPGTTKAGTFPTNFGPADSSPQAIKILDDLIAKGEVIHES